MFDECKILTGLVLSVLVSMTKKSISFRACIDLLTCNFLLIFG